MCLSSFGALIIGILVNITLYGVMIMQCYTYLTTCKRWTALISSAISSEFKSSTPRRDRPFIKLFVSLRMNAGVNKESKSSSRFYTCLLPTRPILSSWQVLFMTILLGISVSTVNNCYNHIDDISLATGDFEYIAKATWRKWWYLTYMNIKVLFASHQLRLLASTLLILTCISLITHTLADALFRPITYRKPSLLLLPEVLKHNSAAQGILSCSVQLFFAWRIKVLTGLIWPTMIIVAFAIASGRKQNCSTEAFSWAKRTFSRSFHQSEASGPPLRLAIGSLNGQNCRS